MEKRKKLKKCVSPLTGYMEDAYPLTVAITKESSYEWIYSNYIQLLFQNPIRFDNQPIKFYKLSWTSGLVWDADCPLIKYDTVPKQIIDSIGIDIIEYICTAINQEYYVKLYLDEYFLPFRNSYQNEHYLHESLFIGYDLSEQVLYGLAYVTDKTGYHFKEFTVDMDAVRRAYKIPIEDSVQRSRIMLMSCNWEKFYEFDIESVKESIYEYINSISTDKKYSPITNPRDYSFGISIYDKLLDLFDNASQCLGVIPFHIILEHKQLMVERIKYMVDNNFVDECDEILRGFEKLVSEANLCKALFMKYQRMPTDINRNKVKEKILETKQFDIEMMTNLYMMLSTTPKKNEHGKISSRWGSWKDIMYGLDKRLQGRFDIAFDLHILNNKTRGYIRFTNDKLVYDFCAPIIISFNVEKHQFGVGDKNIIQGISCNSNSNYKINFTIDLFEKRYAIVVYTEKEKGGIEDICFMEDINFINQMIIIHDNSYYYSVGNVDCTQR